MISNVADDIGVGIASNEEIDKFNIRNATMLAMLRALLDLELSPDVVLVDGNFTVAFITGLAFIFAGSIVGNFKDALFPFLFHLSS